jgi:hypothetical protein
LFDKLTLLVISVWVGELIFNGIKKEAQNGREISEWI